MSACERCGAGLAEKDTRGWYRDYCRECITELGQTDRHIDTCEREDCPVCYSHPAGDADGVRYEHLDVDP